MKQQHPADAEKLRVVVIDALVGNDYSLCLCAGLSAAGESVGLVTVEDRERPFAIDYPLMKWAPSKQGGGKVGKLVHYYKYLWKLYQFAARGKKNGLVMHFQFFRRERMESFYVAFLRLMGLKIVYTAHNIVPHEATAIDKWLKALVYHSVHAIIVHSNYVKTSLLSIFPVPADKVHVIPHGNFDHYLPEKPVSRHEARAWLGVSDTDKVLLFFGYIREYKGLDLLLDAFVIAAAKDKSLKLVIAGAPHTAALERSSKTLIESAGLGERVIFHARFIPNEDVENYFVASDLVVLPYRHIYHSGIVHLAYSYGRASLATNVGDFSETIEQGKSGFVLDENSAEALAAKILDMTANPEQLEEMGRYARALSSSKYSWLDIGRQAQEVYGEVKRLK